MNRIILRSGGELAFSLLERGGQQPVYIFDLSTVTLEDVAWGLAGTQRWGGQTALPYSVAEHSILVASMSKDMGGNALAGLLHDVSEFGGLGDIAAPVKRTLGTNVVYWERYLYDAFCRRFVGGLLPHCPVVHEVDQRLGVIERDWLFPRPATEVPWGWRTEALPAGLSFLHLSQTEAAEAFLTQFLALV